MILFWLIFFFLVFNRLYFAVIFNNFSTFFKIKKFDEKISLNSSSLNDDLCHQIGWCILFYNYIEIYHQLLKYIIINNIQPSYIFYQ